MSACDRLADYRKAKKEYVWKRNATNGLVAGGLAAMALAYWIQPLPKYTLTTSFKTVSCDWANGQPYTELNIERSQVWVRPAVEPKHMDSFEQFARVAHFARTMALRRASSMTVQLGLRVMSMRS